MMMMMHSVFHSLQLQKLQLLSTMDKQVPQPRLMKLQQLHRMQDYRLQMKIATKLKKRITVKMRKEIQNNSDPDGSHTIKRKVLLARSLVIPRPSNSTPAWNTRGLFPEHCCALKIRIMKKTERFSRKFGNVVNPSLCQMQEINCHLTSGRRNHF